MDKESKDRHYKVDPVAIASEIILKRYIDILTEFPYSGKIDSQYLLKMCDTAIYNHKMWPIDKLSRWLGFIQGVMIANGRTDIDSQRNVTRPLFHKAYELKGMEVPVSIGVE